MARCEFKASPGCPQTRITGLPGAGPHKVLVTSRHTLAGLGARLVEESLRFAREARGAGTVFSLSLLLVAAMFGGLVVDVGNAWRYRELLKTTADVAAHAGAVVLAQGGTAVGTGGAVTKVGAAKLATESGVSVLLTSTDNVSAALEGQAVGTWFESE